MSGHWYRRIDVRDRGRRLGRLTGRAATAAVALAGVFGVALARHDRAGPPPMPLRVLGLLVVVATLAVLASGTALIVMVRPPAAAP